MELLVKDLLSDLEQAVDVPKRISEVRAKKLVEVVTGIQFHQDQFDTLSYLLMQGQIMQSGQVGHAIGQSQQQQDGWVRSWMRF